jgi:ADP-ribose pyrophosphatase
MTKPWRILDRKIIYSAPPYIELSVETVELPDGRVIPDYHHLRAGSFATIVAETEDGRFITLRQYRHGVRRIGLALPGGRIDDGEDPLAAAQRELMEEIGAAASSWKLVSSWDTSCTYGFSKSWYFHAQGVRQIKAPADDDLEGGEIVLMTRSEILQALRDGSFLSLGHAAPLALVLLAEVSRE